MRYLFSLLALCLLAACTGGYELSDPPAHPQAAAPQPDAASLKAGLASRYYIEVFNETDDLIDWAQDRNGIPGAPVIGLQHRVGKGEVLTSGYSDEVGAKLIGYLRLPEAGLYQLKVTTNDGVRIFLGGEMIHDDPQVAPDRIKKSRPFEVAEPGWYPLTVWYFEKHNTSTLWVLWKTPQAVDFQSIPLENLKHGS